MNDWRTAPNLAGTKVKNVDIEVENEFRCKVSGKVLQHGA